MPVFDLRVWLHRCLSLCIAALHTPLVANEKDVERFKTIGIVTCVAMSCCTVIYCTIKICERIDAYMPMVGTGVRAAEDAVALAQTVLGATKSAAFVDVVPCARIGLKGYLSE